MSSLRISNLAALLTYAVSGFRSIITLTPAGSLTIDWSDEALPGQTFRMPPAVERRGTADPPTGRSVHAPTSPARSAMVTDLSKRFGLSPANVLEVR
jgi:hypothetical protein